MRSKDRPADSPPILALTLSQERPKSAQAADFCGFHVVAGLAQLVEQRFCKPKVAGSIPATGTTRILIFGVKPISSLQYLRATVRPG